MGTKVIYPGGDTPKEKDTGISFNATPRGGTVFEEDASVLPSTKDSSYDRLLEKNDLATLENLLDGRTDNRALWYKARILARQGLHDEVEELLEELDDSGALPEDSQEIIDTDFRKESEEKAPEEP